MFTSVVGLLAAVALLLLGLHTVQPQSGESSGGMYCHLYIVINRHFLSYKVGTSNMLYQ